MYKLDSLKAVLRFENVSTMYFLLYKKPHTRTKSIRTFYSKSLVFYKFYTEETESE